MKHNNDIVRHSPVSGYLIIYFDACQLLGYMYMDIWLFTFDFIRFFFQMLQTLVDIYVTQVMIPSNRFTQADVISFVKQSQLSSEQQLVAIEKYSRILNSRIQHGNQEIETRETVDNIGGDELPFDDRPLQGKLGKGKYSLIPNSNLTITVNVISSVDLIIARALRTIGTLMKYLWQFRPRTAGRIITYLAALVALVLAAYNLDLSKSYCANWK